MGIEGSGVNASDDVIKSPCFFMNLFRKSIISWTGRVATCVSGSTVDDRSAAITRPIR